MSKDLALFIGAMLVLAALASTRAASRLGIPSLVLFVAVGMLAGSDGPGKIDFENYHLAELIGSLALAVVLFSGGVKTRLADLTHSLPAALTLSTGGVAITCLVLGGAAAWLSPLDLTEGLLLGAVASSTDAAAIFASLKGRPVPDRVRHLLEAESGTNDPMAVFLTVALTGVVTSGELHLGALAWHFVWEMALGAGLGLGLGKVTALLVRRARLEEGLYPVFALASAVLIFSFTNLVGGNGFLAVYLGGVMLGNAKLELLQPMTHFLEAMESLMQIVMFLVLGLLSFPSRLLAQAPIALALTAVLMLVARPLAVFLTLTPLGWARPAQRFTVAERVLLSWAGLKGAVPIILAIVPLLRGVGRGGLVFDIVFFVVMMSTFVQGTTVAWVSKRLGLAEKLEPNVVPGVLAR